MNPSHLVVGWTTSSDAAHKIATFGVKDAAFVVQYASRIAEGSCGGGTKLEIIVMSEVFRRTKAAA
jgi:hypothetical protein